MKYIIFDNHYPVIFPETITHCTVKVEDKKPTSAGYVYLEVDTISADIYGKSGSLNLKPKIGDKKLIEGIL